MQYEPNKLLAYFALLDLVGMFDSSTWWTLMGEALDLVEAVEESGMVYSFAENYPYNPRTLEM